MTIGESLIRQVLFEMQRGLFIVGLSLGNDPSSLDDRGMVRIESGKIEELETTDLGTRLVLRYQVKRNGYEGV